MRRILAILLLLALLCGCTGQGIPAGENQLTFYYRRADGTNDESFASETGALTEKRVTLGGDVSVEDVLEAYLQPPEDEGLVSLFPDGTICTGTKLQKGVLTLEMNEMYASLTGYARTLAAAGLTMTLTQLDGVDAVQIRTPEDHKGRWAEEFSQYREIRLELGCGKGRFTCEQALREPDVLLLALEKVPDAMVVAMERVVEQGIPNVRFLDRDAELLPEMFAPGEISRLYINFPDPWPKKKQFKRRLTAPEFLDKYRALLPEGGAVWFKTDNGPLFDWSLESFRGCGWALADMPEGTPMTDYEARFTEMGLPIHRVVATRP